MIQPGTHLVCLGTFQSTIVREISSIGLSNAATDKRTVALGNLMEQNHFHYQDSQNINYTRSGLMRLIQPAAVDMLADGIHLQLISVLRLIPQ